MCSSLSVFKETNCQSCTDLLKMVFGSMQLIHNTFKYNYNVYINIIFVYTAEPHYNKIPCVMCFKWSSQCATRKVQGFSLQQVSAREC